MSDLRRRLAMLETAHDPGKCLQCAVRRLGGDVSPCGEGRGCREPGKGIVDYLEELNAWERQQKAGTR